MSPWICQVRPESFTVDQDGYATVSSITDYLIKVSGFGFTNTNVTDAQVAIVDENGDTIRQINTTANYHSHYRMSLNIQGIQFPRTDRNKLRVSWPGDNYHTEVGIIVGETEPSSPVLSFVEPPQWGKCDWVTVGYDKSFSRTDICTNGSFLTQLDLDIKPSNEGKNATSPYIGHAQCCTLAANINYEWEYSGWVRVGYDPSHNPTAPWCSQGKYLTSLQLEAGGTDDNSPIVGYAKCARLPGAQLPFWESPISPTTVGYDCSHNPEKCGSAWCQNGTFLVAYDLRQLG